MSTKMQYAVQIAETRNFVIPVSATSESEAEAAALKLWRDAPTTGQWEISDTDTDVVAVTALTPFHQTARVG